MPRGLFPTVTGADDRIRRSINHRNCVAVDGAADGWAVWPFRGIRPATWLHTYVAYRKTTTFWNFPGKQRLQKLLFVRQKHSYPLKGACVVNDYCPLLSVSMPFIKLPKPMWLYRAKRLPPPRPNLPVDRSPGTGKLIKLGSMPPKAVQQLATLSRLATATRSGSGRPAVSTAGKIVNSPKWATAFLRHEANHKESRRLSRHWRLSFDPQPDQLG
jgi:hypothetical protein